MVNLSQTLGYARHTHRILHNKVSKLLSLVNSPHLHTSKRLRRIQREPQDAERTVAQAYDSNGNGTTDYSLSSLRSITEAG